MRGRALVSIGMVLLVLTGLDELYPLSPAARTASLMGFVFSAIVLLVGLWDQKRNKR